MSRYTVTLTRTIEATIEISASSEEDAEQDARAILDHAPFKGWTVIDEDISIDGPDEQRDARADWEYDRDR